nr:zinc ABC transporter substrate-binding protein [Candidatus Sigynarchaeota archaeon]
MDARQKSATGIVWAGFVLVLLTLTVAQGTPLSRSSTLAMHEPKVSTPSLKIMATIPTAADIAQNIAGGLADVQSIVSGATDIHTFQGPTTTQLQQLAAANVTFSMGNISAGLTDIEPWLGITDSTLGGIHIVPLIQPAMLKVDPALDGVINPHVWLDPVNVKLMASVITAELIALDPGNISTYQANNASYQLALDALLVKMQAFKTIINGTKVTSRHAAFSYFFDRLGINQRAIIEKVEGQEPSQTWINYVIDLMKTENITIFVGQPQLNQDEINSIARDANARVASLTDMPGITLANGTLIDSYIHMIEYNMFTIAHPVDPPAEPANIGLITIAIMLVIAIPLVLVAIGVKKNVFEKLARKLHKQVLTPATSSPVDNDVVIELQNVMVAYSKTSVLNDVSLKIRKGEYVGLIGKNGSGKSTLIKTILGLIAPVKGTVKVFGQPVHAKTHEKIGYTPQMHSINHEFPATVGDVVAMGLYKKKGMLSRLNAEDMAKVQLALHKVKMEEYINRPIGHLSGGEQQKVLIAHALVHDPDILLLDEPTSALDFNVIKDILALLDELNKKYGITLIVIQHNLDLLLPFCKRLVMLRRSVIYDGPPYADTVKEAMNRTFGA